MNIATSDEIGSTLESSTSKKRMQQIICNTLDRERQNIQSEFAQVKGLVPLLMKPRNKQQWTPQDKLALKQHLKCLSRISVYIAVIVLPGGLIVLPIMGWWLDRHCDPSAAPEIRPPVSTETGNLSVPESTTC
jgi:hypothetical protein